MRELRDEEQLLSGEINAANRIEGGTHGRYNLAMRFYSLVWGLLGLAFVGCARPQAAAPGYQRADLRGFEVDVNAAWRAEEPGEAHKCLDMLDEDLGRIVELVPKPALEQLRTRRIWIEPDSPAQEGGFSGRGMTFHPSRAWLSEHGILPEKAGGVDICSAQDYLTWREHQPMMVLHEMAHAYHWMLGFDRPDVIAAYDAAKAAGLYEQVDYVLAKPGAKRRAYALNNAKEYFAELTEAYFGRNDYYPFTRDDLRAYNPEGLALVERLWHLNADELAIECQAAPN